MEVDTLIEQLLFTTIRIETTTSVGQGTGTGFVFTYTSPQGPAPFLVTNKHVIANAQKGKFILLKAHNGKPLLGVGFPIQVDDFEQTWFGHPDPEIDVAVMPLNPLLQLMTQSEVEIFYRSIVDSFIPSEDDLKNLDALEEIIFIGYPNGIWDQKNLLPIMRKGIR